MAARPERSAARLIDGSAERSQLRSKLLAVPVELGEPREVPAPHQHHGAGTDGTEPAPQDERHAVESYACHDQQTGVEQEKADGRDRERAPRAAIS